MSRREPYAREVWDRKADDSRRVFSESRAQAAARKAGDYTALLGNLKTADATKKMDPKSVFLTQAQVALARNASVTNGQRATAIKTLRDRLAI